VATEAKSTIKSNPSKNFPRVSIDKIQPPRNQNLNATALTYEISKQQPESQQEPIMQNRLNNNPQNEIRRPRKNWTMLVGQRKTSERIRRRVEAQDANRNNIQEISE
jgi:hypothetical protein